MSGVESLVRVTEIKGKGRALVSSQPLRGGQIVLKDSPILLYSALPLTKQQHSISYCDNCFKTLPSTPPPSQTLPSCCNHHIFCSPKCHSHSHSHSVSPWVCQALNHLQQCPWQQIDQPLDRQVQARFLIAAYNLALVSPSKFQILLSLQGQDSDSDSAAAQFLHSLISTLCPPPSPIQGFSVELTAALLAKDKFNAFSLMEPYSQKGQGHGSVRACGIYPNASMFNHDCLPNACRFDYVDSVSENNTDIIIRMIHDVPEGREICLSYFPVNDNYSSRQKILLEDYGFTCDCDRCKVEANWSDNDNDDDENENENEDEVLMDEDCDEQMAAVAACDIENEEENQDDFPHAYFFLRYMCNRENCWGTLAPLPPSDATPSNVMECNACGNLKNDEDIDAARGEGSFSMDD